MLFIVVLTSPSPESKAGQTDTKVSVLSFSAGADAENPRCIQTENGQFYAGRYHYRIKHEVRRPTIETKFVSMVGRISFTQN